MMTREIITSTFKNKKNLYEQCYDRERKESYFIGYNGSDITTKCKQIPDNGTLYKPILDGDREEYKILEKGVVLLPYKPEHYGDFTLLTSEINDFIYRYLDISEEHRKYATWYTILSWVLDNLNTIPYLCARGDYGAGKTRYLDAIGGICYKPMFVGGAVRSAPIFRLIDQWHGTLILDEFNLDRSDEKSDIIQILNSGYQRGKPVLRCSAEEYRVGAFDAFGAKILATRKDFTDRALESRCVTAILTQTDRTDIPIELPPMFYSEREQLRNKLLMYRFKNWRKINAEPVTLDLGNIQPRVKQSFLPFTVLFALSESDLERFKGEVVKRNAQIVRDNSMSTEGFVVRAYTHFKAKVEPYITVEMLRKYIIDELGWEGRNPSSKHIGSVLRNLGFEIKAEHIPEADGTHKNIRINPTKLRFLTYRYIPEDGD